jgi:hypothetical protein
MIMEGVQMRTIFIFLLVLGAAVALMGIPSANAAGDNVMGPSIVSPDSGSVVPIWRSHGRSFGGFYGGYYPGNYGGYNSYGTYSYQPSTTCVWNGYDYTCYKFN